MSASEEPASGSRREFLLSLGGRARGAPVEVRPPWTDERNVRDACTGCGACIAACPERILKPDAKGWPTVEFSAGECTFCAACADACAEAVFDRDRSPPWPMGVEITGSCLLTSGISCQLCTDCCDSAALSFDLSVRPVGRIRIDAAACTGCGACFAVCPAAAIGVVDPRREAAT